METIAYPVPVPDRLRPDRHGRVCRFALLFASLRWLKSQWRNWFGLVTRFAP